MAVEVEIKSLLGSKGSAAALLQKMARLDTEFRPTKSSKQLNHYFTGGDLGQLKQNVVSRLSAEQIQTLGQIQRLAKKYSVRSRQTNSTILLVVKGSLDETSSANGVSRLELEVPFDGSLEELDKILLDSAFKYQAKWSRERTEYDYKNLNVCIDKNAGYGFLAEFELVVDSPAQAGSAKQQIIEVMEALGIEELNQDRLERMFAHYNANWSEYYGTDKTFTLE